MRNPFAIWSQLQQLTLAEDDVVLYSVKIAEWLRMLLSQAVPERTAPPVLLPAGLGIHRLWGRTEH